LDPKARTDAAILAATRELLAERGVEHLTVEGVAARAGVAKTTIYRRWRSKDELALAVLLDMVEQIVEVPDLGDIRAELIALLDTAVQILGTTLMGRVMQGLASDLATDPALGRSFRERVVGYRVSEVRRLLDRAVERGELRPGLDGDLVHELLFGPVYYRLLLSGGRLDERLAERIVDAVLPSLRAPARSSGARGRSGGSSRTPRSASPPG
jgi:AcrR family transcriptional regulator